MQLENQLLYQVILTSKSIVPAELVKRLRVGMELQTKTNPVAITERMISVLRRYYSEKKGARMKYLEFYSP